MSKDKALFTFKLLVALCLITAIACLAAEGLAEPYTVRIVQASGGLNVRSEPTTSARAVYLLEDTETVVVLEWRDGWALVAKNSPPHWAIGWVCGDYLK